MLLEPRRWEGETLENSRGDLYLWVQAEEAIVHMAQLSAGQVRPAPRLQELRPDMVGLLRKDNGVVRYAAVLQGSAEEDTIWWSNVAGAESGTLDLRRWLWDHGVRKQRAIIRIDGDPAWRASLYERGYRKIGPGGPESETHEWQFSERP